MINLNNAVIPPYSHAMIHCVVLPKEKKRGFMYVLDFRYEINEPPHRLLALPLHTRLSPLHTLGYLQPEEKEQQ